MGEPKAMLPFDGCTLLERVVERLALACAGVVVVARPAQTLPDLGGRAEIVFDELPGEGPLAALATGLSTLDRAPWNEVEWAFVCAVDTPFVAPSVVARMVELASGYEAVVARLGGRIHPLTAVYGRRARSIAGDLLVSGERRATALAHRLATRFVAPDELLGDPAVLAEDPELTTFLNLNTRSDLARAEERRRRPEGAA